jgi:hypothetical protein
MALSRLAIRALLALVSASAGAPVQRVRGQDGRDYLVPSVMLHGDQGVYAPSGAQLPFRRGPKVYVLVRRVPVGRNGRRMVLVDESFRCSGTTLGQLRTEELVVKAADGHGYALTAAGLAKAARALCTCAHPLQAPRGRGLLRARVYAMRRTRNLLRLFTATWRPHQPGRIRITIAPTVPASAIGAPAIVVIRIEYAVLLATYTITAN